MKIKKSDIFKYIILTLTFMMAILSMRHSDSINFHILMMIVFCFVSMCLVKFDILHPYCWFSAFFCLYSIGFPIIVSQGIKSRATYSKQVMYYQLIALFVSLFIISPQKARVSSERNSTMKFNPVAINKIIYVLMIMLIFLATYYIKVMGFRDKGEIYDSGNIFLGIVLKVPLVLSMFFAVFCISYSYVQRKLPIKHIFLVGATLFIITVYSGERDFIFRFIIITIFILYYFEFISKKMLCFVAPLILMIIPISSIYKYYFLGGGKGEFSSSNFLYMMFSGEFESASCNLQVLINNYPDVKNSLHIETLMYDVLCVIDSSRKSLGVWFNEQFFYNTRNVQYGFSLVGEGYLIGGIAGIVLLFILIGVIIKSMYKYAHKNIYFLSSYLYFITIMSYAIRVDFSYIISAIIKQIGLVILVLIIVERIFKEKTERVHA